MEHGSGNSIVIMIDPVSSVSLNTQSKRKNSSGKKSNKCNQCGFASSQAGHLRTHLKTHNGEKLNKCNQCDYASSREGHLRRRLKTHSGEMSNNVSPLKHSLTTSRSDVSVAQVVESHFEATTVGRAVLPP